MILVLAFLAGAAFGVWRARARGGNAADQVQYGLAHGFAALVGMAVIALVLGLFGYAPL
jgi:hypothetical protein